MISDKELFRQMIERDVQNIYRQLPSFLNNFGINISPYLSLFEDKILSYTDLGIDMLITLLFGSKDETCNIDEAADVAKLMVNDKIEEYRNRIKEIKNSK